MMDGKTLPRMIAVLALAALLSCVTINIYFPAEKVEEAAEKIVGDIRSQEEVREAPSSPESSRREGSWKTSFYFATSGPVAAYAQRETTISNAAIRGLKDRIKARRSSLLPYLRQGVLRENSQGYVDMANPSALDARTRAQVQRLVSAENQDRRNLYLEVARALNIDPARIDRIGAIFAREWRK